MENKNNISAIPQYSIGKILLIWAAAAIPMGVLGWLVAPALMRDSEKPVLVRVAVLTVGLIWQSVLVLFLIYRETGTLQWSILKQRLCLLRRVLLKPARRAAVCGGGSSQFFS